MNALAAWNASRTCSARAAGTPQAELEKQAADMQKYAEWYRNPLIRAGITFVEPLPVTVIVSLISALVLSRARKPLGSTV